MIPDLAVIVAAFVITMMVRLIVKEPKEHGLIAVLAVLTILVTLMSIYDILSKSSDVVDQLKQLGLPKP